MDAQLIAASLIVGAALAFLAREALRRLRRGDRACGGCPSAGICGAATRPSPPLPAGLRRLR
ncbi:MAG: hypothetical protein KBD01_09410 [Acidobacteria bacterium]|nr:hypothetical protein [Acidobacteriota bacterium]